MKNTYTYVDHISSHYVSSDCVQLMIGYKNFMTMFNKGGIQYHQVPNSTYDINSYLSDERRILFPYNDIPLHYGRVGMSKYTYTNQLLNFEERYITVSDNAIIERMAILDKDDAFVVSNVLPIRKRFVRMTREQLEDLFRTKNENGEMSFVMQYDGYLWGEDCFKTIITEDEIVEWAKEQLTKALNDYKNFESEYRGMDSHTYTSYLFASDWLNKNISNINIDINSIPKIGLDLGGIVLVKITNGNISVQLINNINFIGPNQYEVIIANLPLMEQAPTRESLRMLGINDLKEPRISRFLNPNIDHNLVRANKRLVRRLK